MAVVDLISFEIRLEVSNQEMISVIQEAEELLNDPKTKHFSSTEELFKELNN